LGLFSRDSGGFGVEVERRGFQGFADIRQVFLRLIPKHRFLPPRIPDLYDWRGALSLSSLSTRNPRFSNIVPINDLVEVRHEGT
jgi:hypothetical protein